VTKQSPSEVHIALTGGRAGEQITQLLIKEIGDRPHVHLWFSDERFVPAGDPQRNDRIVPQDLAARVHRVASSSEVENAQTAATSYAAELHQFTTTRFCADNTIMDVTLLSIGPDGHVASLFPGHAGLDATGGVIAITDSPKPPAQRITWTYPTLNASRHVWLIATGEDKQQAVDALRAGAQVTQCPAAGVFGKIDTRLYTDL
jgi:6-phosphogluconolactonase